MHAGGAFAKWIIFHLPEEVFPVKEKTGIGNREKKSPNFLVDFGVGRNIVAKSKTGFGSSFRSPVPSKECTQGAVHVCVAGLDDQGAH